MKQEKNIFQKEIQLFPPKFNLKRKFSFYHELAILIHAGVDIYNSIKVVKEQEKKEHIQHKYQQLLQQLEQGKTFSNAIKDTLNISDYEFYSLKIGEETGSLSTILDDLANYYKKRIQQNQKIVSALTYPILIIIVSFFVLSFMLGFLVPMFADLYERFDGELPQITQLLISTSETVKTFWYVFLVFPISLFVFYYFSKKNPTINRLWFGILFSIPFFGKVFKKIFLSLFCNAMSLLLKSGVALTESIQLAAKMIEVEQFQEDIQQLEKKVIFGTPLNKAMKEVTLFDSRIPALVKVGEETGSLSSIFQTLTEEFQQEVDYQSQLISTIIEPLIIITLGLIIGIILIALYMPIFNISDQFIS